MAHGREIGEERVDATESSRVGAFALPGFVYRF
jgi:hypothetical protein